MKIYPEPFAFVLQIMPIKSKRRGSAGNKRGTSVKLHGPWRLIARRVCARAAMKVVAGYLGKRNSDCDAICGTLLQLLLAALRCSKSSYVIRLMVFPP
ncbi:hypothetical protein J6590_048786 [Homalodisca vitripennis]|nr:hypothetical protein J6590_048786 [Homalodisca vitripennis]